MTAPAARSRAALLATTAASLCVVLPWLTGAGGSHAAVAGHIAFAMTFVPIALLSAALAPAAAATAVGGLWLAASPWVLGFAGAGVPAWGADVLMGAVLALPLAARRR